MIVVMTSPCSVRLLRFPPCRYRQQREEENTTVVRGIDYEEKAS